MASATPTIISVSYNSWDYLLLNYKLTVNSGCTNVNWLILDNKPSSLDKKKESYIILSRKNNVKIIPGIEHDDKRLDLFEANFRSAAHHTYAINKGIENCDSNIMFIIDPDFFVIRRNWVKDIIERLYLNDQQFFGVTWANNDWNNTRKKWFDFPSPHFQCISCKGINKEDLDFLPIKSHEKINSRISPDSGFRIREYAYRHFNRNQWGVINSCSRQQFYGASPVYYINNPPIIKTGGTVTNLRFMRRFLREIDYFILDNTRFGFHLRSFPKGLTDLSLVKENDAEYVINSLTYIMSILP